LIGVDFPTVLNDVVTFIEQYPREILVLELSHLSPCNHSVNITTAALAQLRDTVLHTLSTHLYPRTWLYTQTIQYMIDRNQTVIVSIEDSETVANYTMLWDSTAVINSYADTPVLKTMLAYDTQIIQEFNASHSPNSLYKVSYTLTPNADTILDSLIPGQPTSLEDLAKIGNKQMDPFVHEITDQYHWQCGQIWLVDAAEASDVTEMMIYALEQRHGGHAAATNTRSSTHAHGKQ